MRQEKFSALFGILGLMSLIMVLLSALALGANRPVSWSLLSIGVCGLFALHALLNFTIPTPLAAKRAIFPGLLFIAAVIWGWVQSTPGLVAEFAHPVWSVVPDAQSAISADPGQGRHAVMRLSCYAMIFVMMLWTCSDTYRAGVVLKIIAISSSVLAGYGLYSFATGENLILDDLTRDGIVQASFVNRNNYATYAAFGVLANLAVYLRLMSKQGSTNRKLEAFFTRGWIFAVGLLLCLGALSLTQSRAGGMAALFGLVVFLLAWRRDRRNWDPIMLLVLLAVLIFIGATSATGLLERLISTDATEGRFAVYPAILAAIQDRPLLGHGIGAFHEAFRPYIPPEAAFGEWVRAHSTYLELAFGLGIPAAAAVLLAQALISWQIWRGTVIRRNDRVFSCFALGCIATAALHSGFDFSLQMPATAALFAVILALGFAQSFTSAQVQKAKNKNGRPRHNQ